VPALQENSMDESPAERTEGPASKEAIPGTNTQSDDPSPPAVKIKAGLPATQTEAGSSSKKQEG
jgi:hypothetical protein